MEPSSQSSLSEGERPVGAASRLEIAALVFFVALAVFHTWPLATAPGTWCRNDNADTMLNEWTVAWVAHAVVSKPLHLFDANIFYPEKRTLAYSEPMLPQSLMVAPVLWLGGSPVLAFNLALMAGFALTGWALCHLVRVWTGSWAAGLVAGSLGAFNAHIFTRFGHLQAMHVEFLPFALLALDRLLSAPRARRALSLAWWFTLQALTSGYFLVFTAVAMISAVMVRPREWTGPRIRPTVPLLALAVVVSTVLLLPFLLPYWHIRHEQGFARSLDEVLMYSATWTDYLASGARIHEAWSGRFFRGDCLFPGLVTIACVSAAVFRRRAWRDPRVRMCAAIAVVTFCLSFGVRFPLYPFLYRVVPLLQGIRAVSRFGHYTLIALAILAGFGVAWWLSKLPTPRWRVLAAGLLLVVANAEASHVPIWYTRFEGVPRIYGAMASQPGAVVAYFPFFARSSGGGNARYMLASTSNWLQMLNGYSGFAPGSFYRHANAVAGFPDAGSIRYLRQMGVTFVVVEVAAYDGEALNQIEDWRLRASNGSIRIYQLNTQASTR
jgi:hypothetical protein